MCQFNPDEEGELDMWEKRLVFMPYDRRERWIFLCGLVGVVVVLPLLFIGLRAGQHSAARHRAAVQSHWHHETGVVTQRGPYQSGAIYGYIYRVVTVQYQDWQDQTRSVERVVNWKIQTGQHPTMQVSDRGAVYLSIDLQKGADPFHPSTSGQFAAGFIPFLLLAAFLAWLVGLSLYRLAVLCLGRRYYAKRPAASPV